jgi:NAD(P)-dependent dehydrogenase (short-subunit alcohol dehydrogenase family)
MVDLRERVAVVTGAGRGIGRAYALRMAAYGARVVVNDAGVATDGRATDENPAAEVVSEIAAAGGDAIAQRGDIADAAVGDALVAAALDRWGRLDIVVNNAGFGRPRMVFNLGDDEWDDVVRVHLRGTFVVSRPACRYWRAEAKAHGTTYGRLINTATGLLLYGGAGQSNYVAAKAGIAAFTAAVAQEMEPYLVTANAIMPGARTRMASVGWRMDRLEGTESRDPVHVAELVCYLASPSAGWISGQFFHVSGHRIAHALAWTDRAELRRADRGWTAGDLVREFPRFFGAGPRPNEMPPKEWVDKRRTAST